VSAEPVLTALGFNPLDLQREVDRLLAIAQVENDAALMRGDRSPFGAVNWADLRCIDIEYRVNALDDDPITYCVAIVQEASPDCTLPAWLNTALDRKRFPSVYVECSW